MAGIATTMQQALLSEGARQQMSPNVSRAPSNHDYSTGPDYGAGRNLGLVASLGLNALGIGGPNPMAAMSLGKGTQALALSHSPMGHGYSAYNSMTGAGFDSVAANNMAREIAASKAGVGPAQPTQQTNNLGGAAGTSRSAGGIETLGDNAGHDNESNCFITTATAEYYGWSDDCCVLEMLRKFRDEIVSKMPTGKQDIQTYYEVAPKIAANLTPYGKQYVWDKYIKRSIKAISAGKYRRAYVIYKNMMLEFM